MALQVGDTAPEFSLRDSTGKLAPNFIITSNQIAEDGGATIVAGNERVIRARLSDAEFFYNQDLAVPLEQPLQAGGDGQRAIVEDHVTDRRHDPRPHDEAGAGSRVAADLADEGIRQGVVRRDRFEADHCGRRSDRIVGNVIRDGGDRRLAIRHGRGDRWRGGAGFHGLAKDDVVAGD